MRSPISSGSSAPALRRVLRNLLLAIAVAAAMDTVAGCGESGRSSGSGSHGAPIEIGGAYHVTGVTIGDSSGLQRPIQGRVKLNVKGDQYTTHFELETPYPGTEKVSAQVIGTGEGVVKGNVLEGAAHLQIVAATVPGVDVGFAFVPRGVSSRVVSSSRAEFFEDGSVRIEIRNEPEEGSDYEPTRTHLVGYRVPEK